jgi:2-desacetyl-2-hydroxyethyl bacteriochlorophyllide A dehydrogenase
VKAALLEQVRQSLVLRDVPIPEISSQEVLVATRSSAICGTDLHILEGRGYVPRLPHILGHEPAGVVAAVGTEVSSVKVGDRIVPSLFFTCERCYYCRVGRHQQCVNLQGILGVLSDGAFAEFFKLPARNAFLLPASISFEAGGIIADAVVTAVHAAKRGELTTGSSAVVIGSGGVGLCLIQVLAHAGIRVAAIDVNALKLALAEKYGAKALFLSEHAPSEVKAWSGEDGVQCVFDCVGQRQSLDAACRIVMNGGRVVVIGEQDEPSSVTSTEIAQRELEIIGSRNGTRQDMVEAIHLVERGAVRPPVAAVFPLEEINQAVQCVRDGAAGRVVVQVSVGN